MKKGSGEGSGWTPQLAFLLHLPEPGLQLVQDALWSEDSAE